MWLTFVCFVLLRRDKIIRQAIAYAAYENDNFLDFKQKYTATADIARLKLLCCRHSINEVENWTREQRYTCQGARGTSPWLSHDVVVHRMIIACCRCSSLFIVVYRYVQLYMIVREFAINGLPPLITEKQKSDLRVMTCNCFSHSLVLASHAYHIVACAISPRDILGCWVGFGYVPVFRFTYVSGRCRIAHPGTFLRFHLGSTFVLHGYKARSR